MITVITAVFNGEKSIRSCLESVANQTLQPIEQLVLDGVSKDGTVGLVKQHAGPHVRLISEPDRGLYDALNKGIRLAKHDIVGFLHADDLLGGPDVLAHIAAAFEADPLLEGVYGDLLYVSENNPDNIVRYWKSGDYRTGLFLRGWMPPHPTLFLRRSVYERLGGFRLDLHIAADYEFMLRALHVHQIRVRYLPEIVTRMRLGGMSNRNLRNMMHKTQQDLRAWQLNGLGPLGVPAVMLKNVSKLPQFFRRP